MPDTRGAVVTPIPPSRLGGFLTAARSVIEGVSNTTWFTPGIPIPPQAPAGTEPRRFDYPTGINISYVPRAEEPITNDQLRMVADSWDLLRAVIETRKDQIAGIPWRIQVRQQADEKNKEYKVRAKTRQDQVEQATRLMQAPDGDHLWQSWIRTALEEVFVLDALALYPFRDPLGNPRIDVIAGDTIKRLLDDTGRTPMPPSAAYQQIVKGVPGHAFTSRQLIYRMRNPRAWKLYGLSQVEQCIWTINLALRRQLWKLNYYTMGNLPEAIAQVPDTWAPDKIKQFQEWWNSVLSGQDERRRQMMFVPGFGGKDAIVFPKQDAIKDEMDEWLARVVCYFFSVSPQPFIKEGMSRFGVQNQAQMSKAEGLLPTLSWFGETFTDILQNSFGFKDLEFVFQEDVEADFLKRAQIQEIRARNGISRIDEIREENGDEPIGVGAGIITGTGFAPFAGEPGAPEPEFGPMDGGFPGGGNGNGNGHGGPGGPGGPGNGTPPLLPGVSQVSGATGNRDVVKAGGGVHAFLSRRQQAAQAELKQLLTTYFARLRQGLALRVTTAYRPHAPLATETTKRWPDDPPPPGTDGPPEPARPPDPPPTGRERVLQLVAELREMAKVTTTGIRQTLNVAADGLEGEMNIAKPVISPLGVGVHGVPIDVPPSAFERLAGALADMTALFREKQQGPSEGPHTDLAAQFADRFERLEDAIKAAPASAPHVDVKVEAPQLPPPAPVNVTVEAPPAPPPAEIHTHVEIPERVVEVQEGAVQVHVPPIPVPPAPIVKVDVQPAVQPAPIVHMPVTIKNKRPKVKVKTKTSVAPVVKAQPTRRKVNRDIAGNVESIDALPIDLDPLTGKPKP